MPPPLERKKTKKTKKLASRFLMRLKRISKYNVVVVGKQRVKKTSFQA